MKKNRSSISRAANYREMSDYWDSHDLSEHWDEGRDVHFDVDIGSQVTYCALEKDLSTRVREAARNRGVSTDTLVNMWLQDKLQVEKVH